MIDAIRAAKDAVDVPVFVKLSPLGARWHGRRSTPRDAGADAIVAINSFGPCLAIDIETGRPRMGGGDGYGLAVRARRSSRSPCAACSTWRVPWTCRSSAAAAISRGTRRRSRC